MLAWIVRLLAAAALGFSAFLLWTSVTSAAAIGCDWSAFDCDAALASPWAKWFGLPVAAGGLGCYLAAFVGSLLAGRSGTLGSSGWRLLELASPLAVGAGLWFLVIQATQLESFCLWCVLTHACGLGMAIAAFLWRRSTDEDVATPLAPGLSTAGSASQGGPPPLGLPTIASVGGLIALVIGQTIAAPTVVVESEPEIETRFTFTESTEGNEPSPVQEPVSVTTAKPAPETTTPLVAQRQRNGSRPLSLLQGRLKIDAYDHAVIGSPEAPHLVVELMDYACSHCREFHDKLTEALERFDGQVAVVIMPVPGEILCNKYVTTARPKSVGACYAAKLSIAVSRLGPDEFERFHAWMLKAEKIPSRTASLIEAQKHVDRGNLSGELRDTDGQIAARIKQYVELAGAIKRQGRFGLPSQILGDKLVVGPPESVDQLCEIWAEAFGLDTPAVEIPF